MARQKPKVSEAELAAVTEELKQSEDWMGAPFDLEWSEYLDRMPRLKKLYLRADLQPALPKPTTSDS